MKNLHPLLYGSLILALVGTLFTFTACEKGSSLSENNVVTSIQKNVDVEIDFSNVKPEEVGRLHNLYLKEAIKKHYSNSELSLKEVMVSLEIGDLSASQKSEIFDMICVNSAQEKEQIILDFFSHNKSKMYFNLIGKEIDKIEDYLTFSRNLDFVANNIKSDISGNDKYVLLSYLETARNSAYFWLPEEFGGSNEGGVYFMENNDNDIIPQGISQRHKDILRSDGVGAGFGMVGWGLSGLFSSGPMGGIGGFLFGAAYGGATASLQEGQRGGWGGSGGCC
jgi:hypothetical protein